MTLPPLEPHRDALRRHVLQYSLKTGDFVLKSGRKSSWFLDTKQTACRADGILLVANVALSLFPPDVDAIGGLTGSDPVVRGRCCLRDRGYRFVFQRAQGNRIIKGRVAVHTAW